MVVSSTKQTAENRTPIILQILPTMLVCFPSNINNPNITIASKPCHQLHLPGSEQAFTVIGSEMIGFSPSCGCSGSSTMYAMTLLGNCSFVRLSGVGSSSGPLLGIC